MQTKKRQTQAERSNQTRIRLIEATLDCLQEFGYHGASLSQILKKAGVSRGAWSHHFNSKIDLIASAAEYILSQAIEITRDWAFSRSRSEQQLLEIFDFIWDNFYTGRHRDVWLEFNVACRTDQSLRDRLTPVLAHFHASLDTAWRTYLHTAGDTPVNIETIMILTINTFRGMAVQSVAQDDPAYFKKLRSDWYRIVKPLIVIGEPETDKKE